MEERNPELARARMVLTCFGYSEAEVSQFHPPPAPVKPASVLTWILAKLRPEQAAMCAHFPEPTEHGRFLRAFSNKILESSCGIIVDWRDTIDEAVESVAQAVRHCGVEITAYPLPDKVRTDWDSIEIVVKTGDRVESLTVHYLPMEAFTPEGSFDTVIRQIDAAAGGAIKFHALRCQIGSDTFGYAVLKTERWEPVEELLGLTFDEVFASLVVRQMFFDR